MGCDLVKHIPRSRVFHVSSLKNGNPRTLLYIIYNRRKYLRTRATIAYSAIERFNNKTRRTQLITYADTHGCAVFLVARFKIGHTLRKLPVTQTATSRFIAYRADVTQVICLHSIRLVAVTQDILYYIKSLLSSVFSLFFQNFLSFFRKFSRRRFLSTFPGVSTLFYSIFTKNASENSVKMPYFLQLLYHAKITGNKKHTNSWTIYFSLLETIPFFLFYI